MTVDINVWLAWMFARENRVTYSMTYRNGPGSFDCSSSMYFAGVEAGMSKLPWPCSTESMHDWLLNNGWTLIGENQETATQRGDIFIWGQKGYSAGAGGHTGMFVDSENIIHCNYGYNTICQNNHDWLWEINGGPYVYYYRYTGGQPQATLPPAVVQSAQNTFERELDARQPLSKSEQPYYEATVTEDYWVEAAPYGGAPEKELFKAGSRVRVYEKVNGYSRIGSPQSDQWMDDNYLDDATDMAGHL